KLLAVIEHRGKVGADLNIGAADRPGDHRCRTGVEVFLRRVVSTSVTEYRLEALAHLGRIDFALFGHANGARHEQCGSCCREATEASEFRHNISPCLTNGYLAGGRVSSASSGLDASGDPQSRARSYQYRASAGSAA